MKTPSRHHLSSVMSGVSFNAQDSNVLKAPISEGVIQEARRTNTKLSPVVIQQLDAAANTYAPLWKSNN